MERDDRPNVLVVLTDQQSGSAMSCAGNPHLDTPHLDALAARGTRFPRAYCTQPLCTPSRASMWTGRMPSEVGVTGNDGALQGEHAEEQLGRLLSRAGYDCGYAGKWHLPELDVPASSGFRRVHPESEDGLVASCAEFLAEERDTPFLLVVSLTEPHGICEWARGQTPPSGEVEEADWTQWPPLPANHAIAPYDAELPRTARTQIPQTMPVLGWSETEWRRYLYAYHRLCERADAQVGALVDALGAAGHGEDTVILFSADHGDQMSAHQWNQKWVLNEESVNVPLIVVEPGAAGGAVDDRLVSVGIDLLPTVAAAARVQAPADLRGRSLLSADRGDERAGTGGHEHVFAETRWVVDGIHDLSGRMVRDQRYKYTCYAWGRNREQLVDLAADPGEMVNLASTGAHTDRLDAMRELLRAAAVADGDTRFARFVPPTGTHPR